jgi:hypothetical protein
MIGHPALHGNRARDGLNDAWEFDKEAVSGRLYDPTLVFSDFRINEFAAMGSEAREGAGLVLSHEAAVTSDIGGKNRRKPALYPLPAQWLSPTPPPPSPRRKVAFLVAIP